MAAEAVHGGEDIGEGGDHGRLEGHVVGKGDHLEEDQHVEHDNVDVGELLEERDGMAMVSCSR